MAHFKRTARGRDALLTLGLLSVLALGACGGSATTSPSTGPDGSVGPGESTGPDETTGPGDSTGPGGDASAAFQAATTALDALDSYTYSVDIEAVDTASGTSHTQLSGTVFNKPEAARLLTMVELDANGVQTSATSFLIIGDEAWTTEQMSPDEFAPWTPIPAAQAQIFIQSFAAYRPEQMFGVYFAGFGGSFTDAGTETKNGVDTTHFKGDESIGTLLGGISGVQGTWTSDAWIATDGGYLVHSEASADGTSSGSGSFKVVVDINDINSADPLEAP